MTAGAAAVAGDAPAVGSGGARPAGAPRLVWIQGPSGQVRVEDGGSGGVPVVFVHGLAGDRSVWAAQLAHLRRNRRAVAFDLHGMGESAPSAANDYSIGSFAGDVAAVVGGLRLGRVVLVGHSMGGHVIAAVAAGHPAMVGGLLFDDPAGDLSKLPREEIEKQWLGKLEPGTYDSFVQAWFVGMLAAARPEVREHVMATVRKTPRIVFAAAARSLASNDPVPAITGFNGPMLTVVTPENETATSLHKVVPSLPSKVIAGTSHWIMMDKPDEFNAAMDAFLAGVT
ncbi:MAG: alpha/beta hydrolase [Acidobacteriia bacterium]|nr:alpha/beta hydrolase [Terriglobia bacterium]